MPNADPAVTGGYNYINNLLVDQNGWQGLARIDFNISDSTKMFVRYNLQRETQPFVIGLWWRNGERQVPYPSAISGQNMSDSVTVSLTHVFDPTLTNETIFGAHLHQLPEPVRRTRRRSPARRSATPTRAIFPASDNATRSPRPTPGAGARSATMYYNPGGFDPILFAKKWQISFSDNLTKVTGAPHHEGRRLLRVGHQRPARQRRQQGHRRAARPGPRAAPGNAVADLLMGGPFACYYECTKNVVHDKHYNLVEGYVQDSWKVKPRLTVDYGVRFAYLGPWYDSEGSRHGGVGPSTYNATARRDRLPGRRLGDKPDRLQRVPRRRERQLLVRLAPPRLRLGRQGHRRHRAPRRLSGCTATTSRSRSGPASCDLPYGVKSYSGSNGSPCRRSRRSTAPSAAPSSAAARSTSTTTSSRSTYSWSLTLDQKLPWSMNVELGYVGNKNDYLLNSEHLPTTTRCRSARC